MAPELNVGSISVDVEPSLHHFFLAPIRLPSRMSSDMKVHMKRVCIIEFLHVDSYSLVFMPSVYGDQTVDMSKCVKNYVVSVVADFYERRIQVLVHYWQKCISTGGDS